MKAFWDKCVRFCHLQLLYTLSLAISICVICFRPTMVRNCTEPLKVCDEVSVQLIEMLFHLYIMYCVLCPVSLM